MALTFASSPLPRSPVPSNRHADRYKFGLKSSEDIRILGGRTGSPAFRVAVLATKDSNKEVSMVDPLEAKRLAAKQMQEIQAKKKYKRKREIEAINGGWAMIGLIAGMVVEGHTGNGILKQVSFKLSSQLGVPHCHELARIVKGVNLNLACLPSLTDYHSSFMIPQT